MRLTIRQFTFLWLAALLVLGAAFIDTARGADGGSKAMGRDLTRTYARAADAERRADPELGGDAIRLIRTDQTEGSPTEGQLIASATSRTGFVVYPPRSIPAGGFTCDARLYPSADLPAEEIERAEMFDVILNAAGDFQRYAVRSSPKPLGATREYKVVVSPVDDPSPLANVT